MSGLTGCAATIASINCQGHQPALEHTSLMAWSSSMSASRVNIQQSRAHEEDVAHVKQCTGHALHQHVAAVVQLLGGVAPGHHPAQALSPVPICIYDASSARCQATPQPSGLQARRTHHCTACLAGSLYSGAGSQSMCRSASCIASDVLHGIAGQMHQHRLGYQAHCARTCGLPPARCQQSPCTAGQRPAGGSSGAGWLPWWLHPPGRSAAACLRLHTQLAVLIDVHAARARLAQTLHSVHGALGKNGLQRQLTASAVCREGCLQQQRTGAESKPAEEPLLQQSLPEDRPLTWAQKSTDVSLPGPGLAHEAVQGAHAAQSQAQAEPLVSQSLQFWHAQVARLHLPVLHIGLA